MRNLLIVIFITAALAMVTCSQQPARQSRETTPEAGSTAVVMPAGSPQTDTIKPQRIAELELPATKAGEVVIRHTGYAFVYDEPYEQSRWVAYELTKAETVKVVERSDKFIPDDAVATGTADNKDYAKSGYDRGHLAPAADMGWSPQTMRESFYFSNMSPQVPAFNRGIWKKLEEKVRDWAGAYDTLYIVTGPVLQEGLPVIGPHRVAVPKYYYKVILDYSLPDVKAIAFLMPNAGSEEPLQHFAVSVDSVERFTGLDFFTRLPDPDEKKIEKTLCLKCWSW